MADITVHDERSNESLPGVKLIVRKGNRYGKAHAGEYVLVDETELLNRSTMSSCMSVEEHEEYLAAREVKRNEKPKPNSLKAAVDAELERIRKQAEEKAARKAELEANAPPAAPPMQPAARPRPLRAKKQEQE